MSFVVVEGDEKKSQFICDGYKREKVSTDDMKKKRSAWPNKVSSKSKVYTDTPKQSKVSALLNQHICELWWSEKT